MWICILPLSTGRHHVSAHHDRQSNFIAWCVSRLIFGDQIPGRLVAPASGNVIDTSPRSRQGTAHSRQVLFSSSSPLEVKSPCAARHKTMLKVRATRSAGKSYCFASVLFCSSKKLNETCLRGPSYEKQRFCTTLWKKSVSVWKAAVFLEKRRRGKQN